MRKELDALVYFVDRYIDHYEKEIQHTGDQSRREAKMAADLICNLAAFYNCNLGKMWEGMGAEITMLSVLDDVMKEHRTKNKVKCQ